MTMAKHTNRGATKSRPEKPATLKGSLADGAEGKKADERARQPKPAKPAGPRKTAPPSASKPKRKMSGLDAAAAVLAQAGKPMNCKDLTEQVFAKGLWKTTGKTPAATIHAAMIREIKSKGKESRFRKVGRGAFAAASVTTR
jgi:hypothetical protein